MMFLWGKFKTYGLAILGVLSTLLGFVAMFFRMQAANAKKDLADRNAKAAEAQIKQVVKANKAATASHEKGQEEVRNAVKKAQSGDRSHFES